MKEKLAKTEFDEPEQEEAKNIRFQKMLEDINNTLVLNNLTPKQVQDIFNLFKEAIKLTESFGHSIDEYDLLLEIAELLNGINSLNKDRAFEKQVANSVSFSYSRIVIDFTTLLIELMGDQAKKYFIPEEKREGGQAGTWYSNHISDLMSRVINYMKECGRS